jgi:16S rRNA A1518/A1519 N6-dimethyltransferase RsmA/KsgA/DIM1 with predicted DNA glycosylase/AP lyase activity
MASLKFSFDQAAGYPQTLIEYVISLSTLPPNGQILKIGCGTGQATVPGEEKDCWLR